MHKQMENPKAPRLPDGGPAAAEVMAAAPTKRQRRPNVRLNPPYNENPGHRKLQHQGQGFKKGAKKPRTVKTLKNVENSKESSNDGKSEEELNADDDDDDDDDMVIGNWKRFKSKSRGKRGRPSSLKNWVSIKSHANQDKENRTIHLSSDDDDDESEEHREGDENLGGNGTNRAPKNCRNTGETREGEEDLGGNGTEKSSSPSPNRDRSFCDGKLSGDEGNVGVNRETGLRKDGISGEMKIVEEERMSGVKVWLNELGLGKYIALFEVHEVDEEVLPFLTLDDLKDMGISAVGSRRKMYCSIQKLGRGFS